MASTAPRRRKMSPAMIMLVLYPVALESKPASQITPVERESLQATSPASRTPRRASRQIPPASSGSRAASSYDEHCGGPHDG